MDPWRDELNHALASLAPRTPAVALYATATASRVEGATLNADYWWQNVRQPVQFAAVLERLLADGSTLFLEVGPHPVLAAPCKIVPPPPARKSRLFHRCVARSRNR
jgi:hybrid polyketide synthase/nonribosomal peptide synthetase FtdB